MKQVGAHRGFTLIEMLVVVVVIVILAMITATLYSSVQAQARDVQVRDAAVKFADAISLYASKKNGGVLPKGGYNSYTSVGANGCIDGDWGWQAAQTGLSNYKCTLGDVMIAEGYLPADFFDKLPRNVKSGYTNRHVFMTYACTLPGHTSAMLLYFSQESPSAEETATFESLLAKCGIATGSWSDARQYGMKGAIIVPFS